MVVKFSFSEKATKNVRNRPYGFEIYLVYLKNQDDCANFCGLRRKAELYGSTAVPSYVTRLQTFLPVYTNFV